MYRIIDLDGTICDDRWRRKYIKESGSDRWTDYHQLAAFDDFVNTDLVLSVPSQKNIIMTGRSETFRPMTMEWLARNGVPYCLLLMRPRQSYLSNESLKHTMFEDLRKNRVAEFGESIGISRTQIYVAYDDNPKVISMWLNVGVWAQKVSI